MADPQPSTIYQFLQRLLSSLGPRSASAEVIKADEGTRTIKGEEDIAQFRAIVKQMMEETLRDRPASVDPKIKANEEEMLRREKLSQKENEDLQNQDDAEEVLAQDFEKEHGYTTEDYKYWREELERESSKAASRMELPMPDLDDPAEAQEVGRLHQQSRMLSELMKQYQPTNASQNKSYQALIDFWDQTVQEHRRALDTYKSKYPEAYARDQQDTSGDIPTPLEPGWREKDGRYEYERRR